MDKEPKQLDLFIPEESQPPFTNRGVTVSIHWLSLTFFTNPAKAMTHFLNEFLSYGIKDEYDWSEYFHPAGHGARGYEALYFGPEGVRLYAYPKLGKHCHLEITGKVIDMYGNQRCIDYLTSLFKQEYVSKCKRIDIAFDHVPFTPQDCYDAWQRGDVIAKCHHDSWDWRENKEGKTLYIGSRQSERFIRIYDRRGFTRLEIVFKDKWSENFARVITEIPSKEWINQCIGYLRDYVNFVSVKPKNIKSVSHDTLSWWSTFIGDSEKVCLNIDKRNANEDLKIRLENYFKRLLPTLYIIRHGLAKDINKIIDNSDHLLNQKHLKKLEFITDRTQKI